MPENTPLVHIIDDDDRLRNGLETLFRSVDMEARGYGCVSEFLDASKPERPSCMLLDVRLPEISGLEFQSSFEAYGIKIPVIFMTGFGDIPMSVRAMKKGAFDFLAKPFRDQDMLDTVTRAIERDHQRLAADESIAEVRRCYDQLTPREREVMTLAVEGLMNKEIAERMQLSEVTVKIYRGSMMRKMGVRSVADLVRQATALGVD